MWLSLHLHCLHCRASRTTLRRKRRLRTPWHGVGDMGFGRRFGAKKSQNEEELRKHEPTQLQLSSLSLPLTHRRVREGKRRKDMQQMSTIRHFMCGSPPLIPIQCLPPSLPPQRLELSVLFHPTYPHKLHDPIYYYLYPWLLLLLLLLLWLLLQSSLLFLVVFVMV